MSAGPRLPHPLSTLGEGPARSADDSGSPIDPSARLGHGAGGVVVRGDDRHLPREVAWKIARGAQAKARLAHEAHVLAALDHPAIVAIHDLVEEDDALKIALRLVRGETLHDAIHRAADLEARLRLVRPFLQAVEAVAWAHRTGWVHRDLKPSNIMVGEFGETQVIDWGLAENLDDPTTPPGVVVGTPSTMSPEQARGELVATTMDVWSLGATLLELVTGEPPHPHLEPHQILTRLRQPDRLELDSALSHAPNELRAIISRCLDPDPGRRYPDARALASDLSAWLEGRRVEAHAYSALELARRFLRAWRLPLGISLGVAITAIVATVLAFDRIGDERDDARREKQRAADALRARDEQIASNGISEAQRALTQSLRPEAELAAARTLAVRESPEARGVLLAFSGMARPERLASRSLPADCLDVHVGPDGDVLCVRQDEVRLIAGLANATAPNDLTARWTHRLPVREAAFASDHIVIAPTDGAHRLLGASGRVLETFGPTICTGRLSVDPQARIALDLGHHCAELFVGRTRKRLRPCGDDHIEVGAIWAVGGGARFAGLCAGGELVVVEPDGSERRIRAVLDNVDTLLAATHFDAEHLLLGGSRGELALLSTRTGQVVRTGVLPSRGAIRSLWPLPGSDRLAIEGLAGDITILSASAFRHVFSLPLLQSRIAGLTRSEHGAALVTAGTDLATWRFASGSPARLEGFGGVTHASSNCEHLVITHDRGVSVLDLASGNEALAATWDGVIAKQAVLHERHLAVGLASHADGAHMDSRRDARPGTFELSELPAIRRVAPLSNGRMIGGRTGLGLVFWHSDSPEWQLVSDRLVTDLATLPSHAAVLFWAPREVVLYEAAGDPMPVAACAVPGATAISLIDLGDSHEPTLLAVTTAGISALRFGDLTSPAPQCELTMRFGAERGGFVRTAATTDGRFIAGATRAGAIHVWRPNGVRVATLAAHSSAVTTLTTSGPYLISGAWDGRVQLMDLDVLDLDRTTLVDVIQRTWGMTR